MMGLAVGSVTLLRALRSRIMAPDILDSLDATTPLPVSMCAVLRRPTYHMPLETLRPLLSWFRPFLRIGA